MDRYLDANKARVKMSLQNEAYQTRTILGEAFQKKVLWKGKHDSYIEKMVVKNGNIFYQIKGKADILKLNDHGSNIKLADFYEPFLQNMTLSYRKPQFLTLGETVIKTEQPYKNFMVAEHFTKKVYFIAQADYMEDGFLYAADISKGAKEVVAEKVEIDSDPDEDPDEDPGEDPYEDLYKFTAFAVDQFSGDLVLARTSVHNNFGKKLTCIESWQKLAHLSEMLTFAGISSSKIKVK